MTGELKTAIELALKMGGASPDEARRVRAALTGEEPAREKLLTTKAAADVLQVHPKTMLLYGRRGLLHPVRRSCRFLRWRASEVERFALTGGAT